MTAGELLAFEEDIATAFERGEIKSPVHLSAGNEEQLIEIFKDVRPDDWVLVGWRSHYHCLLKGVPKDELKCAILDGRSVSLSFRDHKILCSGIVGGIAPIAVGLAHEIKRRNDLAWGHGPKVWCFLGDMTAKTGIVYEAMDWAAGHDLPISWVIEDNGQSVCTDTKESWGTKFKAPDIHRYYYTLGRPHAGTGKWVRF